MEKQKGWKDFKCEVKRSDDYLKKNYHYDHRRFKQMVANHGLEEATKLIATMDDSTGLQWLSSNDLLKYSIEHMVLKKDYREMWEAEEKKDQVPYRELCRKKLDTLKYKAI